MHQPREAEAVLVGRPLSLVALEDVARGKRPVAVDDETRARVVASREAIEAIARAGDAAPAVYGVNTGFGALSEARIAEGDVARDGRRRHLSAYAGRHGEE